jgi:hypothetical protein
MSKSTKAKVEEQLARESYHLQVRNIHKIRAAMDFQLNVAEPITTSNRRQFLVRVSSAGQAAIILRDADRQRAIEQLGSEIHQVAPGKRKLFNKLFQHHD